MAACAAAPVLQAQAESDCQASTASGASPGLLHHPDGDSPKTIRTKPLSDFLRFLLTLFDETTVSRLVSEYFIGVTKAGDAIFYRMGADIADILIRWMKSNPAYVAPKPESPPSPQLYPDNPVMQEVMKYISPQYRDAVNDLIKELDLELVGVIRL